MTRILKNPFSVLPGALALPKRSLDILAELKNNSPLPGYSEPAPDYCPPLRIQISNGILSKGESLGELPDSRFDASGQAPDMLAQYGYDKLDKLDYIRDSGLSSKAAAVMEALTGSGSVTSAIQAAQDKEEADESEHTDSQSSTASE